MKQKPDGCMITPDGTVKSDCITEDVRLVDLDTKMTGEELYAVIDGRKRTVLDNRHPAYKIQCKFKGLSFYGSCVEKNWIAKKFFPDFVMVMGAVRVISEDNKSAYGHDFNPPIELHAWLMNPSGVIIDFALPGLILSGMKECDEQGPFIVGREPAVLIGKAPPWVQYRVHYVINDEKVNAIVTASS